MKVPLAILILGLVLSGCRGSPPQGVTYQTLYLLPDGRYEVAGEVGDLSTAMRRLSSPATTRINVAACSTTQAAKVIQTARALEIAGYDHVGFITTDARRQPACGH